MQPVERDTEDLPVEKRKIRGLAKHVLVLYPGLHEQWVTPRNFMHYVFPPTKLANGDYVPGSKEKWLESMSFMLDDIWWLCELQYHQFWSQIIFDPGAMKSIKSFLHLAPLQQLYFKIDDPDMLPMYKRIKKAVFQFLKRLLRIKESDLNYMSPEKYAEIMKKNNLVPISLLFCLCTLYAKKEPESVRDMVAHVVQYNENLKLDNCVVRTLQLFSRVKTKLKQAYRDLRTNMEHSQNVDEVRLAVNVYRQTLSSSVQFLANAAISIHNFLSVYAEGCEIFMVHDYDFHIIRAYKKLIIPAYLEISTMYQDDRHSQSCSKLVSMLDLTRLEFVKSFHICLNALVDKFSTRLLAQEIIQRIVQLMKMGSKVENFLIDVNSVRSLNDFYELVKKKCPRDVDLTTLDNVFESINKELNTAKEECQKAEENCVEDYKIYDYVKDDYDAESDHSTDFENDQENENGSLSTDECSSEYSDWSKNENSDGEYECYLDEDSPTQGAIAAADTAPVSMSEMGLQSAISQVRDLLPHLGDGFIAMCLKVYKMNTSAVINAIFEDTLPESLKEVDFTLSKIPDDILMEVEREYENTPSTSKSEIEKSGLKEFKRVEYSSYKDMFNDKEAVREAKDIYEKYRNTEEDELYNDDVDEDYEERLFTPLVEMDAEGFYTEYTNLPVYNPNHKHAEEDAYEQEGGAQYGRREWSKNVAGKSQPTERNWRIRGPSDAPLRENTQEIFSRDNSKRKSKNNRNKKMSIDQNSKEQQNSRNEPHKDDRHWRTSSSRDPPQDVRPQNEQYTDPAARSHRFPLDQNKPQWRHDRSGEDAFPKEADHRNKRHDAESGLGKFPNRERREHHQSGSNSRENRNEAGPARRENVANGSRDWRTRVNQNRDEEKASTFRDHFDENGHQQRDEGSKNTESTRGRQQVFGRGGRSSRTRVNQNRDHFDENHHQQYDEGAREETHRGPKSSGFYENPGPGSSRGRQELSGQGGRSFRTRVNQNHETAFTSRNNFDENHHQQYDEEERETTPSGPKPFDFCENPEITRARQQHLRQIKQEKRRPTQQFYNSNLGKSSTASGQDDQEQRDRNYKTVHKSSNANHGRKYYADKKRRQ